MYILDILSYMSPQQPGLNGMLFFSSSKKAFEILQQVANMAEYHYTKNVSFYKGLGFNFLHRNNGKHEWNDQKTGESHELEETPKDVYSMWVHVSEM